MIGNYKNKIDDKGRMTIPAKLRDELGIDIVVSLGFDSTLEMRTAEEFKAWSDSLINKGNLNINARKLQRMVLGNSFELSVDKSGRVNMPNDLLSLLKIDKEVVLVGVGNKVEIHPAEAWEEANKNPEDLSKQMEELAAMLEG